MDSEAHIINPGGCTRTGPTNTPILLTDTKVASIKSPVAGRDEHRDLKVTGLRLRVSSNGRKSWILRARAGDKVVNLTLGTYPAMALSTARTQAEKKLAALARDGTTEALDRTFGAVAGAWIEKVAKPKNSSWKLQERRLELHVLPKWRARKIADIRRGDVRELVDGIEGDILPNRILSNLKTIFRFALSRDWIDASPVEGIEKPKPDTARDHVLPMEEVNRIWCSAELLGFPFGAYVRILMLTAQRRSEVAGMRWESLDLEAGTWTLDGSETKNSRAHLVPLPAAALEILKALPRFGPFVFTTDGTTHMSGFAKLKQKIDTFLEADGKEPMKPWRFHDLRRTAATHLVRLGILEEVVGKVLNHAPQGVTAKVYALHRYEPEKRNALDRWAAEVMRAVTGKKAGNVVKLRPGR